MNYVENQGLFEQNAITLKYLQQVVRAIATPVKPTHAGDLPKRELSHKDTGHEHNASATPVSSTSTPAH